MNVREVESLTSASRIWMDAALPNLTSNTF
jgi:hypothetical protein